MKITQTAVCFAAIAFVLTGTKQVSGNSHVTVPGSSDPWLSGMPDGTRASAEHPGWNSPDVAPTQSPVGATGIPIIPGATIQFSATGSVTYHWDHSPDGPDGDAHDSSAHNAGAEHGIANIIAPMDSLLGLFLGNERPDVTPAPASLDFSTQSSRDYLSLSPALKQPFFIGDGVTSNGRAQAVQVPEGATRLFLGTKDVWNWSDNTGSFEVEIRPPFQPIVGVVNSGCGGQPIPGASVQIGTSTTTSDSDGNYSITNLPAGTYAVTVSQPNYITFTQTVIIPWSAQVVTNDFALYPFPDLLSQPQSQSVVSGSTVAFMVVTACLTNDVYQWQFNGTNLADNGRITGSSSNSLTIANVQTNDAGTYSVIVSNLAGFTNSQPATLTVCGPPVFIQQPISQYVQCSTKGTLSAGCVGSAPLSLQWFQNSFPVIGATNSSYTIKNFGGSDIGAWWLQASNACGVAVSSNAYMDLAPNILVSPANQTVVQGHRAFFGFGACGTVPLPYEWYHNGVPIKGGPDCLSPSNNAALVLNSVQPQDAGAYQFAVWQTWMFVLSKPAKLTVISPPQITKQPVSQTVMQGAPATFQVSASGTKPLVYQWLFNGATIPEAIKPALSIPEVSFGSGGNYQVVVANAGGSVTSAVAVLTVAAPAPPAISSIMPSNGPTNGGTLVRIVGRWFELGASVTFGSLPAASVQVESPTNLIAVTPPSSPGLVAVTVTDPSGQSATVTNGFDYVAPGAAAPLFLLLPTNQVADSGASVTISALASGAPPLTYQWQFDRTNLSDGGGISGSATTNLTLLGIGQGSVGNYSVTVSNPFGVVASPGALLSVVVRPAIYTFTGGSDGGNPAAGLVQGRDGSLYGTTRVGGATGFDPSGAGYGTVFQVTTNGTFTTLYSFSGRDDGAYPVASLAPGSDGNFYGTTYSGGSNNFGTVFQISPSGAFRSLYSLTGANDGANPTAALMQGSDGGFYGTTTYGGPYTNVVDALGDTGYGTVFRITTNGIFSTIYLFSGGNDGGNPQGGLIQGPNGVLYGTTAYGGLSTNVADGSGEIGFGTVFQTTANGALTTLYGFSGGDDGANPHGGLILGVDGNLYGTTYAGGTNGYGSVFQIANGTFNSLYAFTGLADGGNPNAGLIQGADGNLYGTTEYGGNSPDNVDSDGNVGYGTAFKISTRGVLKTEFSFSGIDAAGPTAGLCQGSDGGFYGTASRGGGAAGFGSIFRLAIGSGPPVAPSPPIILSGPTNQTVVAGSNETLVANATGTPPLAYQWLFDGTNLPGAGSSVLVISNVQSANAGSYSFIALNPYGSVTSAVATLTVILSFTNLHSFASLYYNSVLGAFTNSDGFGPRAGLILSGSTLYGTASQGGSAGNGTVFRVNRDGSGFTNLYSFTRGSGSFPNVTNMDGAYPVAGLTLSGNTLYGTAEYGGGSGNGTVFRVNNDGSGFTNLHNFAGSSDGAFPASGLVLSGNILYGTAEYGGSSGAGTVFALDTDGSGFTTLHGFTGGSDGGYPVAGLVVSGNTLYGTAYSGGSSDAGTVFAVNTDGTGFTALHSFASLYYNDAIDAYTNSDGAGPQAGLVLSGDTLYGTASQGGNGGNGAVFAVNTDGTGFMNLHSFADGSDGAYPVAGLVLLGNTLYGTAEEGGSSDYGTVFRVNGDGTGFTPLHSFAGYSSDGAYPMAGVILSGNTLFGTAESGGSSDYGTVFSLSLVSASRPQLTILASGADVILTWPVNAAGFTLQSTTNLLSPGVWNAVSPEPVVVNGENTVTNVISGTQKFYRLSQ